MEMGKLKVRPPSLFLVASSSSSLKQIQQFEPFEHKVIFFNEIEKKKRIGELFDRFQECGKNCESILEREKETSKVSSLFFFLST